MSSAQKLLFEEAYALASSQKINFREACILLGAEPRYYVRVRSTSNLSLLDYLYSRKIERLRVQLNVEQCITNVHPVVKELEEYFSRLEFGLSPYTATQRKIIRESILREGHTVKTVQKAFRSLSVSKTKRYIKFREINSAYVRFFRCARDLSIGTLIALFALVIHGIAIEACISCSLVGWTLLLSYATIFLGFAYFLMEEAFRANAIIKSLQLSPS